MLVDTSQSLGQTGDLLDALHCGAVLVAPNGQIAHANTRFSQMLMAYARNLPRQRFWEFFPPQDQPRLQDLFTKGLKDGIEMETALPRPGTEPLPVILSCRPLDQSAALSGHRVFTVIDISHQKGAEARYHQQYQEITRLSDTVLEQALDLKHYSQGLEEKIQERTAELREANLDSILMLAVASEVRDTDTGAHVLRIKEYSRILARELGFTPAKTEELSLAAVLHDVGKIHVPDEILKKPGPLTPEEHRTMEFHTIAGEHILSKRSFFDTARLIARSHHENWDGSGYPDRVTGEMIPLPARIVHLVDVFDALTTARVYKQAWPLRVAIAEVTRCNGTMFDPHLTEVFLALLAADALDEALALRDSPQAYRGIGPAQGKQSTAKGM